ncbi:MAG: Ig-like domain repeat protein [Nocardioides sp.]
MGIKRTTALLAAAGLAVVSFHGTSAQASQGSASASTSGLSAPTAPHKGRAWIQGAVTDQAGHYLDDVNVEALDADGGVTASSITYEDPDGGHPHGFFRLYVPAGKYQVRFSSLDGEPFRTAYYSEDGAVKNLTVVSKQIRVLDTTALLHAGKVASTTKASLADSSILTTDNGLVRFSVSSKFVDPVDGKVKVTVDGDSAGTVTLSDGAGKLKLDRLPAGQHDIGVAYLGSTTVKGSKAATAVLTVKKKKHHH